MAYGPKTEAAVDKIHPFVEQDFSKDDISSIIWAITFSQSINDVRAAVNEIKADYEANLAKGGMYAKGGILNKKFTFKELFKL